MEDKIEEIILNTVRAYSPIIWDLVHMLRKLGFNPATVRSVFIRLRKEGIIACSADGRLTYLK